MYLSVPLFIAKMIVIISYFGFSDFSVSIGQDFEFSSSFPFSYIISSSSSTSSFWVIYLTLGIVWVLISQSKPKFWRQINLLARGAWLIEIRVPLGFKTLQSSLRAEVTDSKGSSSHFILFLKQIHIDSLWCPCQPLYRRYAGQRGPV